MSTVITPAAFSAALTSLTTESLYLKAAELRNSIAHLRTSNVQLRYYSDSLAEDEGDGRGDPECLSAIAENQVVITRQLERIGLIRKEVEGRGGRWHDGEDGEDVEVGDEAQRTGVNGIPTGGDPDAVMGDQSVEQDETTPELTRASTATTQVSATGGGGGGTGGGAGGGRLTDEELRRRLAERMAEDQEDGDNGMHL